MKVGRLLTVAVLNVLFAACAPTPVEAQAPAAQTPAPAVQQPESDEKNFSQEELDQLLAPIALYPDDLLAQVLMASTYPLDIVSADRWIKANPNLKEKALEDALQKQPWDPSVKSLTAVPQVLSMMSEKLDWTQKLGDAFLGQEKQAMATAQALRKKAVDQGSLKDSKEQKVTTEVSGPTTIIKVEPTNPQVVYVPTYNPTVVYGTWPYPSYPPYAYYPPGYAVGSALVGFTAGAIVGGALWGNCNWGGGNVNVNVNRYNNFNRSNVNNANWNHNTARRGAVPYRNEQVAQQYGRGRSTDAASREQYRGRADGGNAGNRGATPRANAATTRDAAGPNAAGRDAGGRDVGGRDAGAAGRDRGAHNTAFDTSRSAQTRDSSNRGSSSLNSARSAGNVGGAAHGGGGGRAGGGGGRGGRR